MQILHKIIGIRRKNLLTIYLEVKNVFLGDVRFMCVMSLEIYRLTETDANLHFGEVLSKIYSAVYLSEVWGALSASLRADKMWMSVFVCETLTKGMIELGHLGMVPACGLVLMTREENREGQLDSVHPYNFGCLLCGCVFVWKMLFWTQTGFGGPWVWGMWKEWLRWMRKKWNRML